MDKLYDEIVFVNDNTPALNASNLNAMSEAIDQIDDRVIQGYAAAIEAGTYTDTCKTKAAEASASATAAASSAEAAATSEANAKASEDSVAANAQAAADSASAASTSESNAKASETAAATSETNAKASETAASTSASNAATSETNAATSETNAATSATNAATSEINAAGSASAASTSETNAAASAAAAAASAAEAEAVVDIGAATTEKMGLVKPDGSTITVDEDGTIHAEEYSLPTASTTTLGGVKVDGTSILINSGKISAKGYSLPTASTTTLGGVKVDGTSIVINDGVISVPEEYVTGLYPFSTATDEQLANMINGYYSGKYSLDDIQSVWAIGDTRTVSLTAMEASGTSETHAAQSIDLVIVGFDHDDLTTEINGKTKALITLSQKNCLSEVGEMNSARTPYTYAKWSTCTRRTWMSTYKSALPSALSALIKTVSKLSSYPSSSTAQQIDTTDEECFLFSATEVIETTSQIKVVDGVQYEYFKTESNRAKKTATEDRWLLRSGFYFSSTIQACFVGITTNGSYRANSPANLQYGIAPGFCL